MTHGVQACRGCSYVRIFLRGGFYFLYLHLDARDRKTRGNSIVFLRRIWQTYLA